MTYTNKGNYIISAVFRSCPHHGLVLQTLENKQKDLTLFYKPNGPYSNIKSIIKVTLLLIKRVSIYLSGPMGLSLLLDQ